MNKTPIKSYKYASLRIVFVAFTNVTDKLVMTSVGFYSFILLKSLATLPFSFITRTPSTYLTELREFLKSKKLMWLLTSVLVLHILGLLLYYYAMVLLPTSYLASFGYGTYTLLIVLLSPLILKERLPQKWQLYIPLGLFGLYLVVTNGKLNVEEGISIGLIALVFNSLFYALSAILTKTLSVSLSSDAVTFVKGLSLVPPSLVLFLISDETTKGSLLSLSILTTGLILVAGFLAWGNVLLNTKSFTTLGVSRTTLFNIVANVASVLMCVLIFNDPFGIFQWLGIVLVVVSVIKLR